ncbi:DNA cross-link repair protein PSO2/SNM1 [Microbotryomycetes sp. JL221]|nr:DNA cross-link repair protein PSO2/SNM1 [Microbotryomycetes sp. JL221]
MAPLRSNDEPQPIEIVSILSDDSEVEIIEPTRTRSCQVQTTRRTKTKSSTRPCHQTTTRPTKRKADNNDNDNDDATQTKRQHDNHNNNNVIQGSSKDLDNKCPVCSTQLDSFTHTKRDQHVNACLDSQTGPFTPLSRTHSNQNKPRKRLSILPTFNFPSIPKPSMPNAFTALMSGNLETKQWQQAEQADKQKGRLPKGQPKQVPFYKWIEGMQITVDAFRYDKIQGCKAYFLSHAHSDHYQQLSERWCHGPIYCSVTTANLIKLKLKVKDEWIHPLPMNQTVNVQGIDVTLIDANHCPGSVLFLFEGPHTDPNSCWSNTPKRIFRYLHCGDFRASPQHINHPSLIGKKIDACYLDTTYLDSKYCFPPQELVIQACTELICQRVLNKQEDALYRLGDEQHVKQIDAMKGWLNTKQTNLIKKQKEEQEEEEKKIKLIKDETMEDHQFKDSNDDDGGDNGDDDGDEENQFVKEEEEEEEEDQDAELAFIESQQEFENDQQLTTFYGNDSKDEHDSMNLVESNNVTPQFERDHQCCKNQDEFEQVKTETEFKSNIKQDEHDSKDEKFDEKFDERFLIVVGTYSIGKERIVKGIAKALQTKIYCDERKLSIMLAQDDSELHSMLTREPLEAQVHMVWLQEIKSDSLSDYLGQYHAKHVKGGFTRLIGLRPTGWTYKNESKEKNPTISKILERESKRNFSSSGLYPQRDSTWRCLAFGCPYSEHSSFYELTCFALSLDYVKMIPTVNVHSVASRNKMKDWMQRWQQEKKRRQDLNIPRMVTPRSPDYW